MLRRMRSVRGHVLGLSAEDPVLRWVGPIGMALSVGTALIVDLSHCGGGRTLADISTEGPRLEELSPGRSGVATISAGPLSVESIGETVALLAESWPAVVVRSDGLRWPGAQVPYLGALPGVLATDHSGPAVWQLASGARHESLKGVVMPHLSSRAMRAMLEGRNPTQRRWVGAWRRVWSLPWG